MEQFKECTCSCHDGHTHEKSCMIKQEITEDKIFVGLHRGIFTGNSYGRHKGTFLGKLFGNVLGDEGRFNDLYLNGRAVINHVTTKSYSEHCNAGDLISSVDGNNLRLKHIIGKGIKIENNEDKIVLSLEEDVKISSGTWKPNFQEELLINVLPDHVLLQSGLYQKVDQVIHSSFSIEIGHLIFPDYTNCLVFEVVITNLPYKYNNFDYKDYLNYTTASNITNVIVEFIPNTKKIKISGSCNKNQSIHRLNIMLDYLS